ncbi:diguanylate cyclase [Heyndrickxia sporothermodurans]|nr:diguanylate cyclase [Heyndrickxia sporothermodurans]
MYIMMTLFACFPLIIGILGLFMLKKSKISIALFVFLVNIILWQLDVAVLYAHKVLSVETIDFLFRLFRSGSIFLAPNLLFIIYTMLEESLPEIRQSKWRFVLNKYSVIIFYIWAFIVFLIGLSPYGVYKLEMMEGIDSASFLFPIGGKGNSFYLSMLILMFVCLFVSFVVSKKITDKEMKSYTRQFLLAITLGYLIGFMNIFPQSKLLASSISVIVFATSIFITIIRIHQKKLKNMNAELARQQMFLRTIIDMNPNFIYALNQRKQFTLVNKAFAEFNGMTPNELEGKSEDILNDIYGKDHLGNNYNIFNHMEEKFIPEDFIVDKQGNKKWLQTVMIPINTCNNEKILLGVSTDITERKKQEEEMKYLAFHDTLTGLPNRRMFNKDLSELTSKAGENNEHLAVLFLDLDRFKYVNDTLSHSAGDTLLALVAYQLESGIELEERDYLVYRIGGDEFTIVLPNCQATEAELFAMKILKKFKEPLNIAGNTLFITPSIGISIYPEDGVDAETLMKNADTAMYYVKEKGKNGYQLFKTEMKESFQRKMIIEKGLRKAINSGEFKLLYQSQFDLQSNKIIGVEALLSWENPELGIVPPEEFIPIAEEVGLIHSIGEWVLQTACTQCKNWQKSGQMPLKLAVNVSMKQLLDKNFVYNLSRILEETEFNPGFLELEFSEKIAMSNRENIIDTLKSLKSLGVRIAIDDFGIGYSSLNYLGKYPIDVLKIDQSIVKGITTNKENAAIIQSIVSITKKLDMEVIAEGIENKDDLQLIENMKCHIVQGYYIAKPEENPFSK